MTNTCVIWFTLPIFAFNRFNNYVDECSFAWMCLRNVFSPNVIIEFKFEIKIIFKHVLFISGGKAFPCDRSWGFYQALTICVSFIYSFVFGLSLVLNVKVNSFWYSWLVMWTEQCALRQTEKTTEISFYIKFGRIPLELTFFVHIIMPNWHRIGN